MNSEMKSGNSGLKQEEKGNLTREMPPIQIVIVINKD